MSATLSVSRVIQVAVDLTPAGAQSQSLSNMLLLGSTDVIDVVERYREYTSFAAVALDFGSTDPEYLAANLWFQQKPQPTKLWIGRWAATATKGGLRCAPLPAASQLLTAWTAISAGSFAYAKDGGGNTNVTGLNFTAATTLNGVAAIIQAALTGVTVVWNAGFQRFEFKSNTTGATSAVSFLSAAGSGTDISSLIAGRSTSSGAYVYAGQAAETAVSAVTTFDTNYGQNWYGVTLVAAERVNNDQLAVAAYIEAASAKHVFAVTTQEAGTLVAASTTDLAYLLKQLAYDRTFTQYSSSSPYAAVSAFARLLTTDFTANNTVITLMYKTEPGIVAESLNATQASALEAKNCNVFVNYENGTAILEPGVAASGNFFDIITGTDWLAVTLQTTCYNALYTSRTKIPQTDAGTNIIVTKCEDVCEQGVTNGLMAPGVWNSGGFGLLNEGDFMPKGYYVYAPSVNTQNQTDRAARKMVPIQIAAKLAGAVHDISIAVSVNQ